MPVTNKTQHLHLIKLRAQVHQSARARQAFPRKARKKETLWVCEAIDDVCASSRRIASRSLASARNMYSHTRVLLLLIRTRCHSFVVLTRTRTCPCTHARSPHYAAVDDNVVSGDIHLKIEYHAAAEKDAENSEGTLLVHVIEGRNLAAKDDNGTA